MYTGQLVTQHPVWGYVHVATHLSVGTRFLWQGHVCVVRDMLLEDRIRLDDQASDGMEVKALFELGEAWGCLGW